MLYLHGGSYVAASAFGYRALAGALAMATGTGVLVPDYRLAPEHPFPAAVDDALSAYTWMLDTGTPPTQITMAGDSAGAGLVLSLLLTLKEQDLPQPGRVLLLCPWVDLAGNAHLLTEHARAHDVDARLELYPASTHAFHYFWSFLPEAADALEHAGAFTRHTPRRSE
jgi:acetyl esterase/lipase